MNLSPFPVETLPAPAHALVVEGAAAIQCDPGMLGPVVLAAMAASVGNARTIELKPGWREPSVLWVGVVAPSGSAKSPALEKAVKPLEQRDRENFRAYTAALAEHEARKGTEPAANERDDFPPDLPDPGPPKCESVVTSDCTLEGLAVLLQSSPRGILFAADELASFFGGFTRYSKGGKAAGEESRWLSLHRAGPLKLHRKTSGSIRVDRAALSVAGMVQPDVLARVLGDGDFQSGLAARFLWSMPPIPTRVWDERGLAESVEAGYAAMIGKMLSLPVVPDAEPPALMLDPGAERVWGGYYTDLNAEVDISDERTRAMLSKLEGGAARLALVVHLGRWAAGEEVPVDLIDAESMTRGIRLARWFADEAKRVYARLDEPEEERADRELLELIQRKGGSITARELKESTRRYREAGAAQDALDGLVHDGLGEWFSTTPGPEGGRPSRRFRLLAAVPEPPADGRSRY